MTNSHPDSRAISVPAFSTLRVLKRRRLAVAVVVVVLALLAVFGWSEWNSPSMAPATVVPAVSGVVVTEGGGLLIPGRSDIHPVRSAPLVVTGTTTAGARLVRRLTADRHGHFALNLPPGIYTVTALINRSTTGVQSRHPHVNLSPTGLLPQQPHAKVTVRRGHPVHIRITSHLI